MQLARFPRIRLGHWPTPLEPMDRLGGALGGPRLLVKRDDCTGLATGGNKTRKLEFLMGAARAAGADTVVTQGAVQSNHVRQTAAAAVRCGMRCEALLERRVPTDDTEYADNGNVLLDTLFDARLHLHPGGGDMNAAARAHAEQLRTAGARPYFIPGGGSNPIGALGYVDCALELVGQASREGIAVDWIVHATGSTGTQAGLLAGLHGINSDIKVLGVSVRQPRQRQEEAVHALACETADLLGLRDAPPREAVRVIDTQVGGGYGVPTPAMVEAIETTARSEGLLLDPVYSGKGMAGLIACVREGFFAADETVLFLHTGGSAALFAYRRLLAETK